MKVLHVIPSVAQVRGGPSEAILAMVKTLREHNVDAEIATTNDNGTDLLNVPLCQRTEYEQVPIWFFPRFSPKVAAIREFAFSSDFTVWLWQHITEYDLLHIHAIFSYASTAAMAIARLKNIPYIVRPLGQLCEWSLQQSAQKKQIYLTFIEQANLQNSYALHLTSKQEQQEFSKLNIKTPSFVLPHGIFIPCLLPTSRQRLRQILQVPENEPIILFMSRLHHKKGLDYLIPALGKLKEQRFTLVIAGSGSSDYKAEVDHLLDSAGIGDRTYFPGFIKDNETKNLFLQGADIFALTSRSENFGIAVLEAMAAGLPVIVTSEVALSSIVKEHQIGYVTELNISTIASAIKHCLNNPQAATEKGARARCLIEEQYNWDCIVLNLIKIYTALLNQEPLSIVY